MVEGRNFPSVPPYPYKNETDHSCAYRNPSCRRMFAKHPSPASGPGSIQVSGKALPLRIRLAQEAQA